VIQSAFLLFQLNAMFIDNNVFILIVTISAIIHESPIKPGCDRN